MPKILFVQPNVGWQWEALSEACDLNNIALYAAHNCERAEDRMGKLRPEVVVCAVNFPDGDWRRILQQAQGARRPTNVIVVSEHEDIPLYLEAMESGAYDFATLETSRGHLSWILSCAIGNAKSREGAEWAEAILSCPY
jgi:DNA-binding NtrC family response regulator